MPFNIIIGLLIQVVAVVIGLAFWKSMILPYRLVIVQVGMAILCQTVARYFAVTLGENNSWIFNIYMLLEILLLVSAGLLFLKGGGVRNILSILLFAMVVYWVITYAFNDFFSLFNWFFVFSALVIVITYVLVLFNHAIFQSKKILQQPLFILSVAHVVYFACIIPLFGIISNLFVNNMMAAHKLYVINDVVNFLRYFLVAIAFYLGGLQAKKTIA